MLMKTTKSLRGVILDVFNIPISSTCNLGSNMYFHPPLKPPPKKGLSTCVTLNLVRQIPTWAVHFFPPNPKVTTGRDEVQNRLIGLRSLDATFSGSYLQNFDSGRSLISPLFWGASKNMFFSNPAFMIYIYINPFCDTFFGVWHFILVIFSFLHFLWV